MSSDIYALNPASSKTGTDDRTHPSYWLNELQHSRDLKRQYGKSARWSDIEGYWHHDFEPGDPVYNMVYMFGRTLLPKLNYRNPLVTNTPKRPDSIPMASIMDSIDAWLMEEMEVQRAIRFGALCGYLYNAGPVESGWDHPNTKMPDYSEITDEELRLQMALMHLFSPEPIAGHDRARRSNFPFIEPFNPRYLELDSNAFSERTLRWYARGHWVPTRILNQDSTLKKDSVTTTLKPVELTNTTADLFESNNAGREPWTFFYEVHDAEEGKYFWLNTAGQFMFDPVQDPNQTDGLPLTVIRFNDSPISFWGTPDAIYIEPQLLEANDVRRSMKMDRRMSYLKLIMDQDVFDDEEIEKIFNEDVVVLRAKAMGVGDRLDNHIHTLQPHVPGDKHMYAQRQREDAQDILGTSPNSLGQFNSGRRTKYEAQVVEEAHEIGIIDRRMEIARAYKETMQRVNRSVWAYWEAPVVARVIGVEGAMYYVRMRPMDLKADLQLSVDVESMRPPNRQRDKEELMGLLGALGSFQGLNPLPIIRKVLSYYPGLNTMDILPQANTPDQAMSPQDFVSQQQKMMADGSFRGGLVSRANMLSSMNPGGQNLLTEGAPQG